MAVAEAVLAVAHQTKAVCRRVDERGRGDILIAFFPRYQPVGDIADAPSPFREGKHEGKLGDGAAALALFVPIDGYAVGKSLCTGIKPDLTFQR